MPGNWDTTTFFFSYTIIGVLPILFIVWKVLHRTRVCLFWCIICETLLTIYVQLIPPEEVTFFEEERKIIDDYEASFVSAKSRMDAFKKWVIG